jgi:hypothetical protein
MLGSVLNVGGQRFPNERERSGEERRSQMFTFHSLLHGSLMSLLPLVIFEFLLTAFFWPDFTDFWGAGIPNPFRISTTDSHS